MNSFPLNLKRIRIITFSHKVNNVPLSFEIGNLAEDLNVKQVEIVNDNPYKARGKFFLCIAYDVDIEDTYCDNGNYQAIDLGITKIVTAINTEGKFFEVKTPVVHHLLIDINPK